MRKICVVIGSRANYSSIKSAMSAIRDHKDLTLQVVCTASSVLERYGNVSSLIEEDGFDIEERLFVLIEGESPLTMARSTGIALTELASVFSRIEPDVVVTVGDRFETMATTLAAAYMNIPIAHTMGGEVSGTIDESIRHAVTKFAHIHFPASRDAENRIIKLGEDPDMVFRVGCPRIDLVRNILESSGDEIQQTLFTDGVGDPIDLKKPFLLISQHPVTTEFGWGEDQIVQTLKAASLVGMPSIVLWPNADAGSDDISRGIRKWREGGHATNMHFFKNLPISSYIKLMHKTSCLVGNSSSGIREGAFIGTPVVNIGSRQEARERGCNVIDSPPEFTAIAMKIQEQVTRGSYESQDIYGDGYSGKRIADTLAELNDISVQKRICY